MPRSSFGFSQIQQLPLNTAIDSLRNEKQSLHSQHSTFSILITLLTFVKILCERVSLDTYTALKLILLEKRDSLCHDERRNKREPGRRQLLRGKCARRAKNLSLRFALRTQTTKSLLSSSFLANNTTAAQTQELLLIII